MNLGRLIPVTFEPAEPDGARKMDPRTCEHIRYRFYLRSASLTGQVFRRSGVCADRLALRHTSPTCLLTTHVSPPSWPKTYFGQIPRLTFCRCSRSQRAPAASAARRVRDLELSDPVISSQQNNRGGLRRPNSSAPQRYSRARDARSSMTSTGHRREGPCDRDGRPSRDLPRS